MKRVFLYLVLCLVGVAGVVLLGVWYLSAYQGPGGSLSGMMGNFAGEVMYQHMQQTWSYWNSTATP